MRLLKMKTEQEIFQSLLILHFNRLILLEQTVFVLLFIFGSQIYQKQHSDKLTNGRFKFLINTTLFKMIFFQMDTITI